MNRPAMSLMDVIAPPGNRWLMEISRRKTDLPPGVQIVRFNEEDDEQATECAEVGGKSSGRKRRGG